MTTSVTCDRFACDSLSTSAMSSWKRRECRLEPSTASAWDSILSSTAPSSLLLLCLKLLSHVLCSIIRSRIRYDDGAIVDVDVRSALESPHNMSDVSTHSVYTVAPCISSPQRIAAAYPITPVTVAWRIENHLTSCSDDTPSPSASPKPACKNCSNL